MNQTLLDLDSQRKTNNLLSFAQDLTNPGAKDLASRLDEAYIEEWLSVDDSAPVVR